MANSAESAAEHCCIASLSVGRSGTGAPRGGTGAEEVCRRASCARTERNAERTMASASEVLPSDILREVADSHSQDAHSLVVGAKPVQIYSYISIE